jgi:dipeptidyl aminopeptidase/acylaminoacyl peptidase
MFRRTPLALTLVLLAVGVSPALATPPPTAAIFGSNLAQTNVTLSPDGHWLAWVDYRESPAKIAIFDLEAKKMQRSVALPHQGRLQSLRWNDSDTLIVLLSEGGSFELTWTLAYDATGGEGRMLPGMGEGKRGAVVSGRATLLNAHAPHPQAVLMTVKLGKNADNSLIEVSTQDGSWHLLDQGNPQTVGWVIDVHGNPIAREDWESVHHAFVVRVWRDDKLKELLRRDDAVEQLGLVGALPDGSALVVLTPNGRPHQAAWAYPLDGSPPHVLAEDPDTDVTGVFEDPYSGSILGVFLGGSTIAPKWLDAAAQQRYDAVQRAFPNKVIGLYGWTFDGKKTLAAAEASNSPPVYYLIDFTTHRADIAAEPYPALAGIPLGETKEIRYAARDGTQIPAYLTLPPGAPAGPLPLVVLPHGEPNGRDFPVFNRDVQFLATRGYAVLQPQYRGSGGFGEAFRKAGYRQWGGLMQDDVADGVHAMVEQHVADPRRVCILGYRYGGYMALAGAAFTPQLFTCAISVNGIFDVPAWLRAVTPRSNIVGSRTFSTVKDSLEERVGSPSDSKLAAKSPINAAAAINIPVLLIYGADGPIMDEQSERMGQALQAASKPVTVVKLSATDHWEWHTQSRVQVLTSFESFLGEHLNAASSAQSTTQ